jgi:hypothetical protein
MEPSTEHRVRLDLRFDTADYGTYPSLGEAERILRQVRILFEAAYLIQVGSDEVLMSEDDEPRTFVPSNAYPAILRLDVGSLHAVLEVLPELGFTAGAFLYLIEKYFNLPIRLKAEDATFREQIAESELNEARFRAAITALDKEGTFAEDSSVRLVEAGASLSDEDG